MNINLIAVPATVVLVLSYIFQDVKPMLEHLPLLRPDDSTHDDGMRVIYGVLAFIIMLAYTVYTSGVPTDVNGWYNLILALIATAITMAVAGHFNYKKQQTKTSASSASTNDAPPALDSGSLFPPNSSVVAEPNETPNGLPLTAPAA